jgi:hypothetical protein
VDAFGKTSFQGIENADYDTICTGLKAGHGIIGNVRGGSHWVLLTGCDNNGNFYVCTPLPYPSPDPSPCPTPTDPSPCRALPSSGDTHLLPLCCVLCACVQVNDPGFNQNSYSFSDVLREAVYH